MSLDVIKKEIDEKKRKLKELQDKQQARAKAAASGAKPAPSPRGPSQGSKLGNDADSVLSSIDSFLEDSTASPAAKGAAASTPNKGGRPESKGGSVVHAGSSKPVTLSVVKLDSINIPGAIAAVKYSKETQVDESQLASFSKRAESKGVGAGHDDGGGDLSDERDRMRMREVELAKALEEARDEKRKWEEQNVKQMPKELPPSEKARVLESKEFHDFFERTSVIVERALASRTDYDFLVDYKKKGDDKDLKAQDKLVRKFVFEDAGKTQNRPVTSMSWSPKFPELLLASYAKQDGDLSGDEPDGMVLVWNLHMPTRPEFHFHCQSPVLTAHWHPTNPKWIVGTTWGGQVVIWDTREKSTPINRTSLSHGHTFPVFSMRAVPVVNRPHNIVSVSTDAHLCVWGDNQLHEPSLELDLRPIEGATGDVKTRSRDEITTTSFGHPTREGAAAIVLGSDEGVLYKARIYDKPGIYEQIAAHDAPITAVEFHPMQPKTPASMSDIYLTSSYDWTCKLWSAKLGKPLFTFESARDYVYDVQWSPSHPSVFAMGDGTGRLDVWNINGDSDVPECKVQVDEKSSGSSSGSDSVAVSRVRWSEDGSYLAAGTSRGRVVVYAVDNSLHVPPKDGPAAFYAKVEAGLRAQGQAIAAEPSAATKGLLETKEVKAA